eukprot:TRINITY_DN26074_c0_g1_i2.p1 TRINITY_DN26074_c0_g1~~TRINITY_DN26074_c0_g1_i2.p1  ORF type:complete len:310 (+),score=44.56 TRINITY_DN26074_c0_g1_i2:49-930(+)
MTFAVQGLGSVGYGVARRLHEAGGRLIVADINADAVNRAVLEFGAAAVSADEIHAVASDIFVPCALGAGLNETTIPQIRAGAIAGAANNQLARPEDGQRLQDRGILYAPDYVLNAGGVISIAVGTPDSGPDPVLERIQAISRTLAEIFDQSGKTGSPPAIVADQLAERIVSGQNNAQQKPPTALKPHQNARGVGGTSGKNRSKAARPAFRPATPRRHEERKQARRKKSIGKIKVVQKQEYKPKILSAYLRASNGRCPNQEKTKKVREKKKIEREINQIRIEKKKEQIRKRERN